MNRQELDEIMAYHVAPHWQFHPTSASGPPGLRGRDARIEKIAHELAHAIELDLAPDNDSTSEVIDKVIRSEEPWRRDAHEFKTLAIEVLGLHRLGYKIRVRTLAEYAAMNDTWVRPWGAFAIEQQVLVLMQHPQIQEMAERFVAEVRPSQARRRRQLSRADRARAERDEIPHSITRAMDRMWPAPLIGAGQ